MKVKLQDVARAMAHSDVHQGYVDLTTGKVVVMKDELAEKDILNHVFNIEDDWEHYVPLPNVVDETERDVMEDFAAKQENPEIKQRLQEALEGIGSTGRFHRQIRYLLLQNEWRAFLKKHFLAVARDWCEENAIEYEE